MVHRTWLRLALWGVAGAFVPGLASGAELRVEGAEVVDLQVYRRAAALHPTRLPTARTASAAARRVQSHLREAGYELARVQARVEGATVVLRVDEGKLDRIVFPGQDALRTVGLQLALELPKDVFNRPLLEAQIPRLERQFDVSIERFEVRRRTESRKGGLGPGRVEELERLLTLPPPAAHDLYIFAERDFLPAGLEFTADSFGPDGFTSWLMYRFKSAFLDDDRFEVTGELGLRLQDVFEDPKGRRFVSRGGMSARWVSPPLFGLRPFIGPRALLINRQRRDLGIRSYDFVEVESTLGLAWPIVEEATLSLSFGLQYRQLLGVVEQDPLPRSDPEDEARLLYGLRLDLNFGRDLRIDRRDRIFVDGRVFQSFIGGELWTLHAGWDRNFRLGFDEFIVKVDGQSVAGDVTFTDEIRVSDHLRGLFGDEFYTEHILSVGLEYQFAIVRDYLKLGVFHDGALFRGVDRTDGSTSPEVANAFGLGLHTLAFDTFKISIYGVFGFISSGGTTSFPGNSSLGFGFLINQLF